MPQAPLFDPKKDRLSADPTYLQDQKFYRDMYEKSLGHRPGGRKSRYEEYQMGRFDDVFANYAMKQAGLYDWDGTVAGGREGRTFQEELDHLKGSTTPYGSGYGTNRNLAGLQSLSEEDERIFRDRIDNSYGSGVANQVTNRAFLNAAVGKFGRQFGGGIAGRAIGQRGAFEMTPEGVLEKSFSKTIVDQLRRQFGIDLTEKTDRNLFVR
mgnify:FL=1|tara:strand:+ start:90 stop:719 length:630 start_codon:yes stop_codon:yes gene_type:complete